MARDLVQGRGLLLWLVIVFLLAIVVGRATVQGGWAWGLLALAVPILFVVAALVVRPVGAALLTILFFVVALGLRAIVRSGLGWPALLLVPVASVVVLVVVSTIGKMRRTVP